MRGSIIAKEAGNWIFLGSQLIQCVTRAFPSYIITFPEVCLQHVLNLVPPSSLSTVSRPFTSRASNSTTT
jgi:hypothetical protein